MMPDDRTDILPPPTRRLWSPAARPAATGWQRRNAAEPYGFLVPDHASCSIVLMIVPIVMVLGYSFLDNVILNKTPGIRRAWTTSSRS